MILLFPFRRIFIFIPISALIVFFFFCLVFPARTQYSRQQKVWRTFSWLHTSTKSVNKRFECSMWVAPNLMYSKSLYTYYYYKYLLNKIEKIPRNMCSSLILYFQICKHFKLLFLKVFVWYFLFRRLDKFTMGHVYFLLSHYFESCARILQLFTFIVMNIARPYATGKNSPNFLLATVQMQLCLHLYERERQMMLVCQTVELRCWTGSVFDWTGLVCIWLLLALLIVVYGILCYIKRTFSHSWFYMFFFCFIFCFNIHSYHLMCLLVDEF